MHKLRPLTVTVLALAGALGFAASVSSATSPVPPANGVSPAAALQKLLEGNKRFVAGKSTVASQSTIPVRQALAQGQKPFAIVLACSDSRVAPEILFDQGLGSLFVV